MKAGNRNRKGQVNFDVVLPIGCDCLHEEREEVAGNGALPHFVYFAWRKVFQAGVTRLRWAGSLPVFVLQPKREDRPGSCQRSNRT